MTHGGLAPATLTRLSANICLNQERRKEDTCFYLGLFSLTPALLLFLHTWATLPVLFLAGAALCAVLRLHRRRVEAVTLHFCAWLMIALNISSGLLFPPFNQSPSLAPFGAVISTTALFGLIAFLSFALLSLLYGLSKKIMTRKQIFGIGFSFLHALGLIVTFIVIAFEGWKV